MDISYETNNQGERVKVTTYPSGTVIRELDRVEEVSQERAAILARLVEIDKQGDSPRARREALLGNTTWLAALDAEAAKLRDELKGL